MIVALSAALGRVRRQLSARPDRAVGLSLAALTLIPMAFTDRGRVSADTKTYLTLDPGRLLSNARFMWDPSVGAGTVPHQNIGYLFPLGPYYWLLDAAGLPAWVAQRLLWAVLVFAASYGTFRLLRWLGWAVTGSLVAAVAYGFSPYLLSYLARLSAILFPWAALPWLILLAARAARERSWSRAAQFALVVALVGSVNATSLLFVGLGPVIWLAADAASRRVATRAVAAAAGRIGLLCAAVSAWWIAGLRVQGAYGLPILDYTESYQTVASASAPQELLRGLGYWFFYGGDRLDPWIGPAFPYFNDPVVMFVSFGLAGVSLLGLFAPFRGRASMLLLLLVGLVLSVGAAPLGHSTWYGVFFERFATESTAGAALRSTPRAAPLLLLALACGLGAGVEAARRWLSTRRPAGALQRIAPFVPAFAVAAVFVNLLPWFTGNVASSSLLRPESLPSATTDLADYINDGGEGPDGRIFAIPGADFADYRWCGTVDPVLPGLTDRSVLYRELIPQGSAGTADLLNAFDRRLAEGWFEPETLEPIARLLGVETIVVRNDLQHERYRLARPGPLWTDVTSVLEVPDHAGALTTDQTRITLIDEITLARDDVAEQYPITAAFELADVPASAGLTVQSASSPVILAGNGDGIVDLAAAGLLEAERPIVYAAGLDDGFRAAAAAPWWVVTDTNRKQGHRWSSIGSNLGALESEGQLTFDDDPNDSRLALVPPAATTSDDQTLAVHLGDVANVSASSYGSRIIYTAEDAPGFAIDGNPSTAWRAGIAEPSAGIRWIAEFAELEDLSQVVLLQPQVGANDRAIVRVRMSTSTGTAEFDLEDSSRASPGQTLDLVAAGLAGPTERIEIEVLSDNLGDLASYVGQPGLGFAEVTPVRVDGSVVVDDRTTRLPVTADLGIDVDDPLTYLLTRQRIDPATPNRQAPEPAVDRLFDVPADRSFLVTGQARLSATADDKVLANVLATSLAGSPEAQRATATASVRLPGSVTSRGDAAVDGDPATAWQTPFDGSVGASLTVSQPMPVEVSELTITWRNDNKHAAPLLLTVTDGPTSFQVNVQPTTSGSALVTETIPVPSFSASETTITLDGVSARTVPEYYSGVERLLPVGLAEISFGPATAATPLTQTRELDTGCRSDLITLDDQPLAVQVSGDVDGVLDIRACEGAVDMSAGEHRLAAAEGRLTGLDIDRLILDSGGRGSSSANILSGGVTTVSRAAATEIDATLGATVGTSLLILPQSHNLGWTAAVDGVDLGVPHLVDGYANGWLLPPGSDARSIELRWTPQGSINVGLGVSVIAGLLILMLIVVGRIRRKQETGGHEQGVLPPLTPTALALAAATAAIGLLIVGGPLAALTSGAVSLVVLVLRRARAAFVLAASIACVGWAAVSGLVIALEWRYDYANGPDWPLRFTWAAPVTWMVIAAISTHVVLSVLTPQRTAPDNAPAG